MTIWLLHRIRRPSRGSFRARIAAMRAVDRQRLALSLLEPHLLDDIGISAAEARREAERPPWDADPRHRS